MKLRLYFVLLLATIANGQNPNTPAWPASVATDTTLLVGSNNGVTTLSAGITNSQTTIPLVNATNFISPTSITIDAEVILCVTLSGNTYSVCTRGWSGTTPAIHLIGSVVYENQIAWYHNQLAAEIKAIETVLGAGMLCSAPTGVNVQSGTTYTVQNADGCTLISGSNSGAQAYTLPQAGFSGQFTNRWMVWVENTGSGTITITPSVSTIDGQTSLALTTNQGAVIFSNSTNYFTFRGSGAGNTIYTLSLTLASNTVTIGANCSSGSAACAAITGNGTLYVFTSPATASPVSSYGGHSGTGYVSVDNTGTLQVVVGGASLVTGDVSCSGCTVSSGTAYKNQTDAKIGTFTVTAGTASLLVAPTFVGIGATNIIAGTDMSVTPGAGSVTVASDLTQAWTFHGATSFTTIATASNCANGASPAVCGSAISGAVAIPTGTNPTLVVDTSAVTANSRILLTVDSTVTIGGTTCNTTAATLAVMPFVTARTASTSFTVSYLGTVTANPLCVSFQVIN